MCVCVCVCLCVFLDCLEQQLTSAGDFGPLYPLTFYVKIRNSYFRKP